jgi:hypothetical protein
MVRLKVKEATTLNLRPGITNPNLWLPERPSKTEWNRIRSIVLERDSYTCRGCGHRALRYMNIHHLEESGDNTPDNLITICVACHAVLHMGNNLRLQIIEIWESPMSQVEIIKRSREGISAGLSLKQINKKFSLQAGQYPPTSVQYANDLLLKIKNKSRAYLPEPLSAVFVNLKRWQLE